MPADEFQEQISQKVGEPLDPALVADSLRKLYTTGRFQELRAEAEPVAGGVELIFVAQAQFFAGSVRVEGTPRGLDASGLVTTSRLRLGQPLAKEALNASAQRLSEVLAENGYHQAKISYQIIPDLLTQEGEVVFTIDPGKAAVLSEVEFRGDGVVKPEKLASVAGWRVGRQLTSDRLEKGLSRIHQFFVKQKRLTATTSVLGRNYDEKNNTERLVVQVDAGPRIQVRIQGGHISSSKMKEILPMYTEGVADDFAVRQGKEKLEDHFQKQGHFSASVEAGQSVQPDSKDVNITYTVTPGPLGYFVGYAFEGNSSFSSADLQSVLTIEPAGFVHERGVFSREMLTHDTKTLTDLYHTAGYLEATVTPREETHHGGEPNNVFVTLVVNEGLRTEVAKLTLQGLDTETEKTIREGLLTKPGEAYSPARVQRDRESIRSYFNDRGYLGASVEGSVVPGPGDHQMTVEYQVQPGMQERIRRVVMLGNQHTRDGIIRRELQFQPGQPLNQSKLLDSQRRLYDLGVFNQVQIGPQDPQGPLGSKTVLVNVEEAKRWTLGYGGGMEVQRLGSNKPKGEFKASPRFSLDVTRLNVGGRAQTLTFHSRLSTLDKGASLSYYIPRFPTRPDLHLRLTALVDRSSDVLTFTSERAEASIGVEKRYSPATFITARLNFRNVKALDLAETISEQQIPLASRAARIAMFGMSYVNDHRDNPVDASRGSFSIADAGISWDHLGSEANFVRLSGENSTFYRLARHLIFARDTRFAFESPFGGLRQVVTTDSNGMTQITLTHDIPLPERFFMGGSESHRGFSINQAGPRDLEKGFPIGGNALFLNSLELRMPFADNRLGFVLFHDAGNVFSSIRLMRLLKVHQSSPGDFNYTVHAVGLGFRYKTPVGPLRLDIGYSLNPPRFNVVNDSGVTETIRLSKIQFFLGIGQSF